MENNDKLLLSFNNLTIPSLVTNEIGNFPTTMDLANVLLNWFWLWLLLEDETGDLMEEENDWIIDFWLFFWEETEINPTNGVLKYPNNNKKNYRINKNHEPKQWEKVIS